MNKMDNWIGELATYILLKREQVMGKRELREYPGEREGNKRWEIGMRD